MTSILRSGWLAPVALTLLGVCAAYQLTLRYLGGDALLLPVVAVAALGLWLLLRPQPAIYLLLGVTFLLPRPYTMSFAGVRTDAGELLAYGLIAAWIVLASLSRLEGRSSFAPATWTLLLAIVVGAWFGASHGVDVELLKGQTKAYLLYFLILPLGALVATTASRQKLERGVIAVASIGATYLLVKVALGQDTSGGGFNTLGVMADAQRVKAGVLELMVVATMLVLARLLTDSVTLIRVAQLALFLVVFGLSFYRSIYLALIVGALLLVVIAPGQRRLRRALQFSLVVAIAAPLALLVAASGALGTSGSEVPRRLASIVSPEITQDSSYTDRSKEAGFAVRALLASPVFGVGIAGTYGAQVVTYSEASGRLVYVDRPFSHNSYLQLYLQLGLLGMLALAMLSRQVVRHLRQTRQLGARDDAIRASAAAAALFAFGVKALWNTQLLERPAIVAVVVAITLVQSPVAAVVRRATVPHVRASERQSRRDDRGHALRDQYAPPQTGTPVPR